MIGLDVTHEALLTDDDAERLRASGRTGADGRGAVRLLPPLPRRHLRVRRVADPRRGRGRTCLPARPRTDRAPPRRDRLRVRAQPRPHGRRSLAADRGGAERPRRRRNRRTEPSSSCCSSACRPSTERGSRTGRRSRTRMAKRRTKRALRPRTPSRVKRRKRASKQRSHHHPELIGLGLTAVGLFLADARLSGLGGRPRRRLDRRRDLGCDRRRRLPAAGGTRASSVR